VLNAQRCKYDMYKSSLRHIHDPVVSSLKMKGIRSFFLTLTEVFSVLFPQLYGKCQGKTRKDGARPALFHVSCCVVRLFVLFYVLFVSKCVLPPGDNQIAVNIYIIIILLAG
jgi:hypothetical protein